MRGCGVCGGGFCDMSASEPNFSILGQRSHETSILAVKSLACLTLDFLPILPKSGSDSMNRVWTPFSPASK